MKNILGVIALLANMCFATEARADIGYQLVFVGDSNNKADTTGFGAVGYNFYIGKYDVTIGQYTTFLNAVARADPYGLYNTSMGTDFNSAGISRTGSSGNYSYSVIINSGSSANRPITYVDWFDAARFANWMANNQPVGPEGPATTENGAYDLSNFSNGLAVPKNLINPNTGKVPSYYIPLENEWYKAAYYNGAAGYSVYPAQSSSAPGNNINSSGANQANYFTTVFSVTQSPNYINKSQNYLSDIGAYQNSGSYYGTFDQGGNVWQWNDLDGSALPYRGLRGGYWFSGSIPLQSTLYSTDALNRAENGTGFRLASPVTTGVSQ